MNNTVLEFECIGMDGGSKFPIEYTGRGQDISPEFIIKNLSPNAKTLAVTLEDLSHPIKDFTHWVIWNIPAADKIKKNIPAGKTVSMLGNARQGIGYGFHRYAGPKPPKGKKHTYRFTVYSLDCEINISANSMKRNFLKKAERYIIQKGCRLSENSRKHGVKVWDMVSLSQQNHNGGRRHGVHSRSGSESGNSTA